jgi:IS30 family transposase
MCELAADREVSWTELARQVGCHRSSIQREVDRNGGRDAYSAQAATIRARRLRSRSRFRFDHDPGLAKQVQALIVAGYSPYTVAQITGTVCAETIYQGIYSGRLGLDPTVVLRTRRPKRRHRHLRQPTSDGNYLGTFIPIRHRPRVVNDREQFGHWEGDLITGTANQSAIITLIERVTRYQVALTLPDGHSADRTMDRLTQWLDTNPGQVESITWDRGAELTRWTRLRDHHGIEVYFCDPKSPWQRATNENANRQLRFWFPRRTDLSIYTQADADQACHILNTTPRRIHNNQTAQDLYHHHTRINH